MTCLIFNKRLQDIFLGGCFNTPRWRLIEALLLLFGALFLDTGLRHACGGFRSSTACPAALELNFRLIREEAIVPALVFSIPMILLPVVLRGRRWQKIVATLFLLFVLPGVAVALENSIRTIRFFL